MKKPVLPKALKLPLSVADRNDLNCGMPTKCIISRALGRTHPEITYVKTNPNKLTITYWGTIYIYAVGPRSPRALVPAVNGGGGRLGRALAIVSVCAWWLLSMRTPTREPRERGLGAGAGSEWWMGG
jgi:hypothetical protein